MNKPKEFIDEAIRISGYLKENQGLLYANYTLDGMDGPVGLWDTRERIRRLRLGLDLSNKDVLEIGSNTGAMSFALAQRGARVTGIEINRERVDLCGRIAAHYKMDCSFLNLDVEDLPDDLLERKYEVVLCARVDAYVKSLPMLLQNLSILTNGLCVYESNRTGENQEWLAEELRRYFGSVVKLEDMRFGTGAVSNIFNLKKPISPYHWHKSSYRKGNYWVKETSRKNWQRVREIFTSLPPCKHFPEVKFVEPNLILTRHIDGCALREHMKQSYRQQIGDILKFLFKNKVCHRDLHWGNLIFDEKQVWVIDWELLHHCDADTIADHYDVSGKNQITPKGFATPRSIFSAIGDEASIAQFFNIGVGYLESLCLA